MRERPNLKALAYRTIRAVTSAKRLSVFFLVATASATAFATENIVVLGLFKDKAIVEIGGKRHVLSPDKAGPGNVKLLSASSKEAVIEVDGKRASYTLGTHIGSTFTTASPQASVRIWPDASGMYAVTGSINGFSVEFMVDTGATFVALNRVEAKRLGLDYRALGEEGRASTASGVAKAYFLSLRKVRVGEVELRDVKAAVLDGDSPTKCLLGMSFLGRLDMVRDGQVMELRKK